VLETFRNAWKIEDLRKRLLFTLLILVLFRLGCALPVPYISAGALTSMFAGGNGDMLEYLNMMSGGALSECTLFALGVQPAINASIIMQLLAVAIPYLENLAKEGEEGQRKMRRITNYVGAGIGLMLSIGYYFIIRNMGALSYTEGFAGIFSAVVIVLSFTAGSQLCTWMGNQIDSKGIGNGLSLMIFAGIVARWSSIYTATTNILARAQNGEPFFYIMLPLLVVLALVAVVFVVILTNAERRIPVQYAKRVVGRKMYGGQSSHIPMKVNMSGVLPIIFAQSIATIPATIGMFAGWTKESEGFGGGLMRIFDTTGVIYCIIYFLLIVGFSYFYATIQFNPIEVANNLKKNGGFVPGFRPGKPTADFITKVLSKITMFGALYLAVIAIVPIIVTSLLGVSNLAIGGTSVIIVVGVALETVKQLEAQMLMRHYKGFLE
jgi:preprotein translocase SecY subunit